MPRAIWINPTNAGRHLEDITERRIQICRAIDRNGFDWQVWAVAASGFFCDSYNLFATNVILPALAFVYWPHATDSSYETLINVVTLVGSIIGQLLFGFMADKWGRRRLYGLELIIVIVATIGVAQSSQGVFSSSSSSMDIFGWLIFWRLLVGIGIGAEYPLSAVITAEFAPVQQRARMMAAVFIMQPIGQVAASLVGLGAVMGIGKSFGLDQPGAGSNPDAPIAIDRIWRIVIGVGCIPALVAIIFRVTIPESPRFTLDVENDVDRAVVDTKMYFQSDEWDRGLDAQEPLNGNADLGPVMEEAHVDEDIGWPAEQDSSSQPSDRHQSLTAQPNGVKGGSQFTKEKLKQYFWTEGNWRYLAGTSLCWFFLDFAFYGLGINNPRTIAGIWASKPAPANATSMDVPNWNPDLALTNATIYQVLVQDAKQSTITISIGSLIGSLVLLKAIDYVPRKNFLVWSFVALATLLVVTGGSFFSVFRTDQHAVSIVFYALSQFVFNLGPNTLTFIIPAEIFPTRYRCTCHGISAASGKLGSVIVQMVLLRASFGGESVNDPHSHGLGIILIIFAALMLLGALFAWLWLPDVQEPTRTKGYKLQSRTLEDLAAGRVGEKERKREAMGQRDPERQPMSGVGGEGKGAGFRARFKRQHKHER